MFTMCRFSGNKSSEILEKITNIFRGLGFVVRKDESSKINFYLSIKNDQIYPRMHFMIHIKKNIVYINSHIDYRKHSNCVIGYNEKLLSIDAKLRKQLKKGKFPIKFISYKKNKKYKKTKENGLFLFCINNRQVCYL